MPEHGGVEKSEVLKVTQLSNGARGQYAQMLKQGTRGSPEEEGCGLGTHILLKIVPLYFFWLCLESFFLHLHFCEKHHFL